MATRGEYTGKFSIADHTRTEEADFSWNLWLRSGVQDPTIVPHPAPIYKNTDFLYAREAEHEVVGKAIRVLFNSKTAVSLNSDPETVMHADYYRPEVIGPNLYVEPRVVLCEGSTPAADTDRMALGESDVALQMRQPLRAGSHSGGGQ